MAGKNVAVVVLPRFTSFVGPTQFFTQPIPVAAYSRVSLTLWVGPYVGAAPTASFGFEESNDSTDWFPCGAGPLVVPSGPGEVVLSEPLTRAWMRMTIGLTGVGVGLTCAASGFFELRER